MSKFNEKTKGSMKIVNKAGGSAYSHTAEMELVVSVLTTFLNNKFYESGDERTERIKGLIQKVDPEFVAKLAIVARKEFHLRSVSHLLVGELSKRQEASPYIRKAILSITQRPDDLTELVGYLDGKLSKQVKRGVRRSLYKFNRYQLAKYKQEGRKVKLVDLFNLVHPKPEFATEEQKRAWKDLIKGDLKSTETWESQMSSGKDKKEVWKDLIMEEKLGYMALLRNLRNIDQWASSEVKKKACEMISNREIVKKSKQLPFRFYSAYQNVENQDMLEAINQALEYSTDNIPKFEGKTLIAVDGSGSMMGDPIEKSSVLASALIKSNDADVVLYDERIREFKYLRSEPALTMSQRIQNECIGGGTNTSQVFEYANQKEKKYDRIIILSDKESWQDSDSLWRVKGTQTTYNAYRKINDCFVYAIDIEGYGTKDITSPKVFHLAGFSDRIFDFIKWIEKENQIVDYINKIEL